MKKNNDENVKVLFWYDNDDIYLSILEKNMDIDNERLFMECLNYVRHCHPDDNGAIIDMEFLNGKYVCGMSQRIMGGFCKLLAPHIDYKYSDTFEYWAKQCDEIDCDEE